MMVTMILIPLSKIKVLNCLAIENINIWLNNNLFNFQWVTGGLCRRKWLLRRHQVTRRAATSCSTGGWLRHLPPRWQPTGSCWTPKPWASAWAGETHTTSLARAAATRSRHCPNSEAPRNCCLVPRRAVAGARQTSSPRALSFRLRSSRLWQPPMPTPARSRSEQSGQCLWRTRCRRLQRPRGGFSRPRRPGRRPRCQRMPQLGKRHSRSSRIPSLQVRAGQVRFPLKIQVT